MITSRRTILIIAAALLIGALAAVAVGVGGEGTATGMGGVDGGAQTDAVLADDGATAAPVEDADIDPAKQAVTLDKFVVKNPFIPLTQPNTAGAGGTTTPASAKVKVNGTSYTVAVGDKVPANGTFTISAIRSSAVTFALQEGREFSGGSSSVTVSVGQSVKVKDADSGTSYTLAVVGVGTGGGAATGGHTVSLVSVSQKDGVAMCTIEVDGTTYADKKEGDTFSTGWGDVKIVSINVGAQSVVILHGDQTLTLYVGTVLTK